MRCRECNHPIVWDETFGWLHKDFGPKGRSFDHPAAPRAALRVTNGGDAR